MIKILIDLSQFLYSALPLATCVAIIVLFGILLSKSIKKYATIYYIVLGIPFVLVAIPFFGRMFGFETFNFNSIPFLGGILRDYIHAGTFGFPLLIVIMYMGALNPKITWVKKLLSIRKELSIISGFPILTHSLIRVTNNFPNSLKFFIDNEEYSSTVKVTNELGAGITNFSFALGIVLVLIFIPLWISSFDSIHKRMGSVRWKKLQKWSYVLYALLFIHAIGIQAGFMLNPRDAGHAPRAIIENTQNNSHTENAELQANSKRDGKNTGKNEQQNTKPANNQREDANANRGRHTPNIGFSDIKVNPQTGRYIHTISLVLIFGSYLYLRLRKARLDTGKSKYTEKE